MRIVATRLHTTNEDNTIDTQEIVTWCEYVLNYCDLLIVVVDTKYLQSIQSAKENFHHKIQFFHIDPWISFTQPLNMLVEKALSLGAKELLFQSIEVNISLSDMNELEQYLDKDTLVVGVKLHSRHSNEAGVCTINGFNSPWNTLALWNIQKLGLTGFLSVSSGNIDGIDGGIEEVVTISLLQQLKVDTMKAKVIDLPSVSWDTKWDSVQREEYHRQKMDSKQKRSLKQLQKLGIQAGKVEVVL